jgi:hypothetical protein
MWMRFNRLRVVNEKNLQFKSKRVKSVLAVALLAAVLLGVLAVPPSASAQSDANLAEAFKPILHFTSGEMFYPTSVDYIIGSSVLKLRESGETSSVIESSPTPENLGTYTTGDLFLDNKLGTLEAIAADYSSKAASIGYYTYAHVVRSGQSTVIQYWLFYVYNNGPLNNHQGDIEVVEVFLDNAGNAQTVLLSQHGSGENAAWNDVEKTGSHPIVYVAQGSHANFFRSYQGKIGIENDVVGSDGKTIADLQVELLTDQGWLDFPGRWGYWGTDEEVILGQAGPKGPVFNQEGIRWADPQAYLNSTMVVNGTYFLLAWLAVNFLLFFAIYIIARSAWKGFGIFRLHRKGGLLVGKFLRGRVSIGLMLGIAAIVITLIALFLPWYVVTASAASPQLGPLSQQGGVTLLTVNGIQGVTANMFMGAGNTDSTSGYVSLFSAQLPFAIIVGSGIIFLVLDVIGIKSGKSLGKKLWLGIISTLLPIIFILLFISQLPAFLPFAAGLFPGQSIPTQVGDIMRAIGGSPVSGTMSSVFPVVGVITVSWGLAVGAYLFIVAAVLRLIGGFIMYTAPEPQPKVTPAPVSTPAPAAESPLPPPPPAPETPAQTGT